MYIYIYIQIPVYIYIYIFTQYIYIYICMCICIYNGIFTMVNGIFTMVEHEEHRGQPEWRGWMQLDLFIVPRPSCFWDYNLMGHGHPTIMTVIFFQSL